VARVDEVALALVHHLRGALGAPALELAEPAAPLGGGFDTEIYAFRLRQGPPGWERPLVLRLLRAHHDPAMIPREEAAQNTVAAQGYPAPRVLLTGLDPAALGARFAIMERAEGVPLLSQVVGMAGALARAQLKLHALDPTALRGVVPDLDGYLARQVQRIEAARLDGLRPLLDWLRARRPPPAAAVICHGDFHPQNVLVQRGEVTAVLDWPNAVLAEPAFDVASTLNILRWVPAGLAVPGPLRWLAHAGQRLLASRYLATYRGGRPLGPDRLAYFEVAAALRAVVRGGEAQRLAARGLPVTALDRSPFVPRLLARAARVTGLDLSRPW
jgi:aminoglycoside phosphotransferase (APT) family kinase protein